MKDVFKILTGRQLTQNRIDKIMKSDSSIEKMVRTGFNSKFGTSQGVVEGNPVIMQTFYSFMETPDISYGRQRMHHGFYPVETIIKTYTTDGRLMTKEVFYGGVANPDWRRPKKIEYSPPGRFMGKRIE